MRIHAILLGLAVIIGAVPAQAGWGGQFLSDAEALKDAPAVPWTELFIEINGRMARISDILLAPVHVGQTLGPGLQLPNAIQKNKLVRQAWPLKKYDLNNDGQMDKAELTRGLIAYAVGSKLDTPLDVPDFYVGTDAATAVKTDRFMLNYDDASYLRRVLVQHGGPGALDMLEILATAANGTPGSGKFK